MLEDSKAAQQSVVLRNTSGITIPDYSIVVRSGQNHYHDNSHSAALLLRAHLHLPYLWRQSTTFRLPFLILPPLLHHTTLASPYLTTVRKLGVSQ